MNHRGHGEHREFNEITEKIIDAAINVHKELGPGLLESTYEACLEYELLDRGLIVQRQKELPVIYRGVSVDCGFRIDLLVEQSVIVELKSVKIIEPVHIAQLITYLKLSNLRIGLILNFNVHLLKHGIKRVVI